MIRRAYVWSPDYADAPDGDLVVELTLVDVGEVRATIGLTIADRDTWGADELVIGPHRIDELDELAVTIAEVAAEARRWERETAR